MDTNMTIDFDKMFENYVMNWYKEHSGSFESVDDMEELMPELYREWAESPCEALGGIAPRRFFDNIKEPAELIEILIGTSEGESNPCSLLLDRIGQDKSCAPQLVKVIEENRNPKLTMIAVNLLKEMDAAHPVRLYLSYLKDTNTDPDLKELIVEVLSGCADDAAEDLYDMLGSADLGLKTLIAEILVNAKKDERTYALLTELFGTGDNIPLYAGYLGKYGDERAASMLYRALDTCNYMEYLEIKNAIERMGGVVDDSRDFSDDVYYKAIKHIK